MEALYIKLYEKYSKLKSSKENHFDQLNQEQEVKFMEFVSGAENLIKHLEAENRRLSETFDTFENEIRLLRTDKDQQLTELQGLLMKEKEKNHQLSVQVEQLRNLQQERAHFSNRSDQHEEQHLNSSKRKRAVFRGQADVSPIRRIRTRAETTNASPSSPSVTPVRVSAQRELSADKSNRDVSEGDCCQGITVSGDHCSFLFQSLVESLTGMKVSVGDPSEGKCVRFVHQSSGYSFSLTWDTPDEGELLYKVISLGTFASSASEWMKEVIVFHMNMFPVFFKRVHHVINHSLLF